MQKFELGFAYRGSSAPEVKQVVEARSMREAMLDIIDRHGGDGVVLVTHAQYLQKTEPPQPCCDHINRRASAPPFMLAPE